MEKDRTLPDKSSHNTRSTNARMKTAIIMSPGKFEFQNISIPKPLENEVLIRMEGCGICGSDLPVWQGRKWFEYPYQPGAPGHEGFGTIEALGSDVTSFSIGDRVTMLSYHAYSEFDIADASQVVKLPDQFSELSFPGEPLGCSMNIFKRAQILKNDTVAIIGAGFIGNLLIQLCKAVGARVIVISRRESSLKMAFESGADHIIKMDDHYRILQTVNNITNGEGCSHVIEATGKQWPLDIAGEIVGTRGRLIIAGFHQDGLREINVQNWNWKGIDVINAHERDPKEYIKGMHLAIEAVKSGILKPKLLFTHMYGFEQLNSAFKDMAEGTDGYIKGIVRMQ